MLVSNEVHAEQSESVELKDLNQRERLVLQLFRQLDQQQQKDILRFFDVLLNAR
ncbi:hypothetical protein [Pseudomonas tolaasii]